MAGLVPPRLGEQMWICAKCGKRFRPGGRGDGGALSVLMSNIVRLTPKCPKCGSRMVHKDFTIMY